MKRWIVFGLVTLAVIVLLSPGIVGKLAEHNLRAGIEWAGHENERLVVTEERFDRGWFTAAGRHRVELGDAVLAREPAGTGDREGAARPALIIDTRIDHGLVPLTSMARDAGSLKPALASTVSALSLDPGDGRIVELPGRLYSRIGLTGATDSHYRLAAGSFAHEALALEWHGADVRFSIDAAASDLGYRGRIEPLEWTRDGRTVMLGATEFEGGQRKTPSGFGIGEISVRMQDLSLTTPLAGASGFDHLVFTAESKLRDERLDGASSIGIGRLVVPGLGTIDVGLEVAVTGLDAARLHGLRETFAAARKERGLDHATGGVYPLIEDDLRSLLVAGLALRVDRLSLALPQGDVHATLDLDLPRTDPRRFSWPGLLLAMKGSARIRLPAALVELARERHPEARSLVAMGFLKREGEDYVVEAEYAEGLVTINGAPMPLPFPAR